MSLAKPDNPVFRNVMICVLLSVLTFSAFDLILENEFILYDDPGYVTENDHVLQGLTPESIVWAFQTTFKASWIPITWLTHILDVELYGVNPKGHHLNNLILHITNVLLVFALFYATTKKPWVCALAAVLFAVHPLRVESVAWVSERKDVLCGFFGLSACMAYVWYARSLTRGKQLFFYWLTVVLLALGLMSKPMLVTWPFLFLVLDFWPLKRLSSESSPPVKGEYPEGGRGYKIGHPIGYLVIEKIPFFCLAVIFSIIAFYAQQRHGAVHTFESSPLNLRLANVVVSYGRYIGKIFWPADLSLLYPLNIDLLAAPKVILSSGLLILISGLCILWKNKRPYLLSGWLWFLGTLVPVIGVVQIGAQSIADRYTYLPSIGISLIVAFGLYELAWKRQLLRIVVVVLMILLTAVLLLLTWVQCARWKNSVTVFRHAVHVTKNNFTMQMNYGYALLTVNQLDEALIEYQKAAQMRPLSAEPLAKLGQVCIQQGRYEQAVAYLLEAIEKNKDAPLEEVYNNLGIACAKQGRLNTAIVYFEKSLQIDPMNAETLSNAAKAYLATGELNRAESYIKKALEQVHPKEQPELRKRLDGLQQEISLEKNKKDNPTESPEQ